jgi:4-amino-4-deoxy-L-arabinose transferase-like glycosyltransferase
LSFSRTLALDDTRANELAQSLAFGYQSRQPPLYEWLLWTSQQIFGTGLPSHLALRYSLIAALGYSAFLATRAAIRDQRWAAIASLSLVASYPVGWTFHEWATQTILLSIACFLTIAAAIRHLREPSLRTSVELGLAIGLGLLAKFSYPLFLGGLLLAALSMPEARARLADRRLLISLAVAALVILPYAAWLFAVRGNIAGSVAHAMIQTAQPHVVRVALGLKRLATSLPLFLLPWIAFVALLAPAAFRKSAGSAPGMPERLAGRTMAFAALLAALGVVAIGATNIGERYMHAILMIAPVYVFARVARLAPAEETQRRFVVLILAAAIVVLGIRFLNFIDNGFTRRASKPAFIPYEAFARALNERGLADGTAVAVLVRDAGNLRAFLPNLRVMSPETYRLLPPPRRPSDDRSCILIWVDGLEIEARAMAPLDGRPIERIAVRGEPSIFGAPRSASWLVARLDPATPVCR